MVQTPICLRIFVSEKGLANTRRFTSEIVSRGTWAWLRQQEFREVQPDQTIDSFGEIIDVMYRAGLDSHPSPRGTP
jgi:hypothetical protein